jgi:acyl-CoA reductase-like NAD-dependent aldehyde dehydrogenase
MPDTTIDAPRSVALALLDKYIGGEWRRARTAEAINDRNPATGELIGRVPLSTGMVGVNIGVAAPVARFPFAGWKGSINGDLHANGRDAIEFYTHKKGVTERWN